MKKYLPLKSAVVALLLVLVCITGWEFFLRHKGFNPDFDDSPELWADTRDEVYQPSDKATVFIGSSRIKYDLDIPTWEKLTGTHAVQLAMVGSSPRAFLADLAADPKFKGKLIIDVTEVLFFNLSPRVALSPNEGINYYQKRTPAQTAGFTLDKMIEPRLVLLDKDFFSLNALLNGLHTPDRKGVYAGLNFPVGFSVTQADRQTKMSDRFVADTNLQNQVKGVWAYVAKLNSAPPIRGRVLNDFILSVKQDIDQIRARGGDVVFLRTPSSGPYLMGEKMGYPRNVYWDKLLAATQCKGIYFSDYPALKNFTCPEFSHLKPQDAVLYTAGMVDILKKNTQWKF